MLVLYSIYESPYMFTSSHLRAQEHGNVLFIILIAVALFAALSYAVTQSSRGGAQNADAEKAELLASEVMQQTTLIKAAVDRVRLLHGCEDNEIAFFGAGTRDNDYFFPTADSASINNKCNVYHPDGGQLNPVDVPIGVGRLDDFTTNANIFSTPYLPLRTYVPGVGRDTQNGSDWEASELAIAVQMLSKDVCVAINNGLGIKNPNGDPPSISGGTAPNVLATSCGILASRVCGIGNSIPIAATELYGQHAACFYNPGNSANISSPRYTYYHVLVPG